jgi:O-antigen ligase
MFGIPYTRQDWIDAEMAKAAARDPFGHRLHVILGLTWLFLSVGPVTVVELAVGLLWGVGILRAYVVHRTWRSVGCHPTMWVVLLWALWQMASIAWSPDPAQGWVEVSRSRWIAVMWLNWSILPYRGAMITALVLGFLAANAAQVLNAAGHWLNVGWMVLDRNPDRNPGWWQPVVAGSMLTAALGLHLPAAVMGSGRTRWLAMLGAAVTTAGVLVTGSRGAWLASAALILIVIAVGVVWWFKGWMHRSAAANGSGWKHRSAVREEHPGPPKAQAFPRRALLPIVFVAVAGGVLWLTAGDAIVRRYDNARDEIRRVIDHRDYTTWTGARVLMAKVALRAAAAHPVRGVGAGGYQKWGDDHRQPGEDGFIHVHAHNTYLHIAATTGLVGLGLFLTAIGMGLYGALRGLGTRMGTYAAGPGFALLGLLLVGMTDVIQLNAQTAAMLYVLLGLSFRPRPMEGPMPAWDRAAWGRPFP